MDLNWVLWPPVAFVVVLILVMLQAASMKLLGPKGTDSYGKRKPYACGEANYEHSVRPDYGQFFGFAFFFTVMHVVVMMITTVPKSALGFGLFYAFVAVGGLLILFKQFGNKWD